MRLSVNTQRMTQLSLMEVLAKKTGDYGELKTKWRKKVFLTGVTN